MDNFLMVLSFSWLPFCTALLFSITTPPLGASLYLRNEVLLGLALPPVGSASVALAVLLGVPPESNGTLYLVAFITIFAVFMLLPLGTGKERVSLRRREIVLAAAFVLGNALTMLFMALSTNAEAHLKHLLNGELLAIGTIEFITTLIVTIIGISLGFYFRGMLIAFSLDEEALSIKSNHHQRIKIFYRLGAALVVTLGIILVGPILCTALLILPPLLAERKSTGIENYTFITVLIGFFGTAAGFICSIILDLPPSYIAVCGMVVIGVLIMFFKNVLK
ncbi:MAG: metal ABC transporter permease [bacterium]